MPLSARLSLEQHVTSLHDSSAPAQPTRTLTTVAWQLTGIAASSLLLGLYARGGPSWPLGFIALVPWLLVLSTVQTLRGAVASALLMSVGFALAVFAWFGAAFGAYVGLGSAPAILILAVLAPLLQPQVLAFALARHWAGRRRGALAGALAGASAWVGLEWLIPKLLGDTLGHGLLPSALLRQMADLGGAAGLSVVLLLVNEALASAIGRWRHGTRAVLRPIGIATVLVVAVTGYGMWRLSALQSIQAEPAPSIRIGLIQSNITHYERLREEMGAYAVIRHVLDTHYAMSEHAVHEQGAEALLWSETVYPTTFGSPKSEDGAELDQEILAFVERIGVPLVFGTYDLDVGGEYNSAAFVEPGLGLLGHYRKANPFPLTEHVPGWLDGPRLRRWLPWAGNWQPGSGARVLPLRTADGRLVNVLPLICLDDVRGALAIEGARLGAQAILGLSNDAWFTDYPQGARLHLAVAAFRSIETRLPQLRVTTNGLSALIDESGEVLARTDMGQQAVLVGEIPVREPSVTLMVRWGDWVGPAGLCVLLLLALADAWRLALRRASQAGANAHSGAEFTAQVALLTPPWRALAGLLRMTAGLGLAWLLTGMLLRTGLQVNSLAQLWLFGGGVLAPALAAWAIQRLFAGKAHIAADLLVFEQASQRIEIPLHEIQGLRVWRLGLPRSGVDLVLASGKRWRQGVVLADPQRLSQALTEAGSPARWTGRLGDRLAEYASIRATAHRRGFDNALIKFGLFPLVPALPAFRLHQHIAFGGTFGEYYTYGLTAWLGGLLIWWASWAIGLMLFAAGLRIAIEAGVIGLQFGSRTRALAGRYVLEWLGRAVFYVGVPVWLVWRMVLG